MTLALFSKRSSSNRLLSPAGRMRRWVDAMRNHESRLESVSDAELRDAADAVREGADQDGPSESKVVEFSAIVGEAIYRSQGIRLYDVQRQALKACLSRNVAEMQTGEGKTVVTGAIAAVNTILYPNVHVATTNSYLAARDLESMEATFDFLGITHALLPEENDVVQSRAAYRQQVVYGPGYQFGFDYLRDQMELRKNRPDALGVATISRISGKELTWKSLQDQTHHLALIDEADSVLIDEALTPLIISLPTKGYEDPAPFLAAKKIASAMERDIDYHVELPSKKIEVTEAANQSAHESIANRNFELSRPWRTYITNAIRAQETFEKDIDYVVVDGQVQIVDQNTGRILPDRSWQAGLHQAVEAKEGVEIQPGRESTTQVTRQRYLQLYQSLSGLTGTAMSAKAEFRSVYQCGVISIPTNKPSQRKLLKSRFFASQESKLEAIAAEVQRRHSTGQPILVGTKTIQESLQVHDALARRGMVPVLLNGIQDREESEIVAQAGTVGSITIATNMAGRGTDIKIAPLALEAGGLHVIGASPNASKRTDRQLVGRAARQGQPGSAQFFVAATDSVIADNKPALQKQISRRANKDGDSGDFSVALSKLQDEIEARNYQIRQKMILRDYWMDTVRDAIEKD